MSHLYSITMRRLRDGLETVRSCPLPHDACVRMVATLGLSATREYIINPAEEVKQ